MRQSCVCFRRVRSAIRLAVSVFLVTSFVASAAFGGDRVRITNGEWPPYLSRDLPHYGIASRIVSEAFAREGIAVEYGFFPWRRGYEYALSGEWDGTAVWLRNPERDAAFHVSAPIVMSRYVFFHLKSFPFSWRTTKDLRGLLIGATRGYDYGEAFMTAARTGAIALEYSSSDEQNFARLLAGRIHLFPIDEQVGQAMLAKHFAPAEVARLTHDRKPLREDALHLLLSRKVAGNDARMVRFNRGLEALRKQGVVQRYLDEGMRAAPSPAPAR